LYEMAYTIVGLGNPGKEYEGSRHNMGRTLVARFSSTNDFSDWKENKKAKAFVANGEIGKEKVVALLPNTFMNKSGETALYYVKSKKTAEKLVVVYDDIDLPLGSMKISFGRGSGGHRGVESIVKFLKTKDFIRVRVGVAPTTPSGKIKKPKGEKEVVDFLLKNFRKTEQEVLKKIGKRVDEALSTIITEGRAVAMNKCN